jgi:hypothetical protein
VCASTVHSFPQDLDVSRKSVGGGSTHPWLKVMWMVAPALDADGGIATAALALARRCEGCSWVLERAECRWRPCLHTAGSRGRAVRNGRRTDAAPGAVHSLRLRCAGELNHVIVTKGLTSLQPCTYLGLVSTTALSFNSAPLLCDTVLMTAAVTPAGSYGSTGVWPSAQR